MPTIPNDFVPQVGQSASNTPGISAPGVAPMQNFQPQQAREIGNSLERAGEMQLRVAEHIQNKLDDANVKAAESQFIQTATNILHGDNGYMTKQGADALNDYDAAQTAIAKAKQDTLDSLGNKVQKQLFNQVATQHLVTFGARMSEHRAQQRTQYTSNEDLGRAETSRVMANNEKPGSKEQLVYIETGVNSLADAFAVRGITRDSAQFKEAERKYRTQITTDNVSRLMTDNQYEAAKTLLSEQVKAGNVDPDVADHLRSTIQANLERQQVITTADKIFSERKGLEVKDVEQALAKVDQQVTDPEQNKTVRALVNSQFDQAQRLQNEQKNELYKNASDYFFTAAKNSNGIQPNSWKAIPTALFQQLTPEQQYNFIMAGKSAAASNPEQTQDNVNARYWFATHPYFTVQDVTDRIRVLTPNQIIEFSGQAAKRASGVETKAAAIDQKQLQNSLLHAGLGALFGDSLEKLGYGEQQANKQRYLEIQNDVQGIFDAAESSKKAPLNPGERQKLLDDYLINNVVYKNIHHTFSHDETVSVGYANLADADIPNAWVDVGGNGIKLSDIPPGVAEKIRTWLVSQGKNPSWQNIAWHWVDIGKPRQ